MFFLWEGQQINKSHSSGPLLYCDSCLFLLCLFLLLFFKYRLWIRSSCKGISLKHLQGQQHCEVKEKQLSSNLSEQTHHWIRLTVAWRTEAVVLVWRTETLLPLWIILHCQHLIHTDSVCTGWVQPSRGSSCSAAAAAVLRMKMMTMKSSL